MNKLIRETKYLPISYSKFNKIKRWPFGFESVQFKNKGNTSLKALSSVEYFRYQS